MRIQDLGVRFWAFRTEFVRRRESEESRREAEKAKGRLGFEGLGLAPKSSHLNVWLISEFVRSYRGTSLIRNYASLGPYSRNMPRLLWRS